MPKEEDPYKNMKVETIHVVAQQGGSAPPSFTQIEPPVQDYITDAVLREFLAIRLKYRLFHRAGLKIANKKSE